MRVLLDRRLGGVCLLSLGLVVLLLVQGCSATGASGADVSVQFATQLDPVRAYRLQGGDTISVQFHGREEFDQMDLVIREDGRVSTTFGELDIMGLTIPEAEERIRKVRRVQEALGNPVVAVQLTVPAPRFVWVGGEVLRPGSVAYHRSMTGLEAMMEVGGNLPTGKTWNALLIRYDSQNKRTVHRVNFRDFESPLLLLPRDIVYVPRTNIANVNVWVDQYIRRILPVNPTVGPL